MTMKTIVALPGRGIDPEVVDATRDLLMGRGLTGVTPKGAERSGSTPPWDASTATGKR